MKWTMRILPVILLGTIFAFASDGPRFAEAQTPGQTPTGFYWPTDTAASQINNNWVADNCSGWGTGTYPFVDKYHTGWDISTSAAQPVYAIADGFITHVNGPDHGWGDDLNGNGVLDPGEPANYAILATHKTDTGQEFLAVYGHVKPATEINGQPIRNINGDIVDLNPSTPTEINPPVAIKAGDIIATIGPLSSGDHLHFGITEDVDLRTTLGRLPCPSSPPSAGQSVQTYLEADAYANAKFVNPRDWITTKAPLGRLFQPGDVFVSVSNGQVQHYDSDGNLIETLDTLQGGSTTGMAFDKAGNLYVTNFNAGNVRKFNDQGKLIGTFGSGYSGNPESIVFDAAGNAYVGSVDGDNDIRKFDPSGTPTGQFNVATERRGSDWIDLAPDQCTMFYTSEGTRVKRFDVCTNTQLADFASGLHGPDYAMRILPDGGLLVADTVDIHRLDNNGNIKTTYDAPGENCWFALNLDRDGKSFWSADFCTSNVYKFDIVSGTMLQQFNTGTASNTVFGLAVAGEITRGAPTTTAVVSTWKFFAQEYLNNLQQWEAFFAVADAHTILSCAFFPNPLCFVSLTTTIVGLGLQHWATLNADPPDDNFQEVVALGSAPPLESYDDSALAFALARFGTALNEQNAILEAIITTIERMQGAEEAGEPAFVALQAEALQGFAQLLLENQEELSDSLASLNTEFTAAVEPIHDQLGQDFSRWATQGLSTEERQALEDAGRTPEEIQLIEQVLATLALVLGDDFHEGFTGVLNEWEDFIGLNARPTLEQAIQELGALIISLDVNVPPAANAGPDQTLECTSPAGATATLDGTGSSDPDGDPLAFSWADTGIVFDDPTTPAPSATFPLGPTTVNLTVTDPGGLSDTDSVDVTVQDTTPPTLAVTGSEVSLWPANHKYVPVDLSVEVDDLCDSGPTVTAVVQSNEADDAKGGGDGNTTGDIKVTTAAGDVVLSSNDSQQVSFDPINDHLELRAERAGGGEGRIYTITFTATDASVNETTDQVTVTVPHDQQE